MIWYWLERLGGFMLLLFGKPPTDEQIKMLNKRLDPNLKCPCCGATDGELRCTEQQLQNNQTKILMQHRCKVCRARFFENPIAEVNPSLVLHAIPVNDVEKAEDQIPSRKFMINMQTGKGVQ